MTPRSCKSLQPGGFKEPAKVLQPHRDAHGRFNPAARPEQPSVPVRFPFGRCEEPGDGKKIRACYPQISAGGAVGIKSKEVGAWGQATPDVKLPERTQAETWKRWFRSGLGGPGKPPFLFQFLRTTELTGSWLCEV